jgi:hypothetical protein
MWPPERNFEGRHIDISRSRIRVPSVKLHVRSVSTYHVMAMRHGTTASIVSTSHVGKLTMPFAKYEITTYGIGVAVNDMPFIRSFVKTSQLLPTLNEGHTEILQSGLFALREGVWATKGATVGF